MTETNVHLSVVVPAFNESENVVPTVETIKEVLDKTDWAYEIIFVNDGSTDDTAAKISKLAEAEPIVRPAGYPVNAGRGKALRTGLQLARGEFVASIDADLSFHPSAILDLLKALEENPDADFAIASPYMKGGRTQDVPAMRLLISKLGNRFLRWLMPGGFRFFTGVFRCYRREMLDGLVLESDGKEIHLEILTKALALGHKGVEVPTVLRGRKHGRSKFRFRQTAISHIIYGLHEKPMMMFGLTGLAMLAVAVGLGIYLLVLSASGVPVADRPLLQFAVFLGLIAALMAGIGFIAIQNVMLRNELYKIASRHKRIADRLEELYAERSQPPAGPSGEASPRPAASAGSGDDRRT